MAALWSRSSEQPHSHECQRSLNSLYFWLSMECLMTVRSAPPSALTEMVYIVKLEMSIAQLCSTSHSTLKRAKKPSETLPGDCFIQ